MAQYDPGQAEGVAGLRSLSTISALTGAMRSSRVMPHSGTSPYSVLMPLPPCVWIAASTAADAASAAAYFASFAGFPGREAVVVQPRRLRRHQRGPGQSRSWPWPGACEIPWVRPRSASPIPRASWRTARRAGQRVAADADADRGTGDAFRVQAVEHLAEALVLPADELVGGKPHVVERTA